MMIVLCEVEVASLKFFAQTGYCIPIAGRGNY